MLCAAGLIITAAYWKSTVLWSVPSTGPMKDLCPWNWFGLGNFIWKKIYRFLAHVFNICFCSVDINKWSRRFTSSLLYTWSKLCIRFLIKTKSLAFVQIFFFKAGYELIWLFFKIFKWSLLVLISVDYWNKRCKCLYWFFILLLDTTLCLVSNTCKISRKLSHIITLLKVHIVFFFFAGFLYGV